MPPRLRASASDGQHHEMLTKRGGSEWSGDRRSAEWRRVSGSARRARHRGQAELRREGEASTSFWRGCGISRIEGRRQKTYDIIEISLIVDASKPGLIRGARMRKRDGDDDQNGQQRDAQARETRDVPAIENRHSRLDLLGSGGRHYKVGEVRRQQRRALTVPGSEGCTFIRSSLFAERRHLMIDALDGEPLSLFTRRALQRQHVHDVVCS